MQTRCRKRYRLGSVGSVTHVGVTYGPSLQKATCAVQWEVGSRWGF